MTCTSSRRASFSGDLVLWLEVILHVPPLSVSISGRDSIPVPSAAKPTATQWVGEVQETPFRKLTM